MLACTLKAEYKSPVDPKDHLTEEITKGVSALRVLSPAARECLITEAMGLLFSPSHNSAYQTTLKKKDGEMYHPVYDDAQFISSKGKVCNFYKTLREIINKKTPGKSIEQAWKQTKQAMASTSAEALFVPFEKEVTKMALATAKYYLKSFPPKLRDAWLALYGDMAYTPDGNDAPFTEESWKRFGTVNFEQMYTERKAQKNALYTDSSGDEYNLNEVWEKHTKQPDVAKKLRLLTWSSNLIGVNDILELYPKEVKAMKKFCSEAKEQLKKLPR